jgi:hypothetical protein|tara:strand:- start:179 stop:487 length:309 start_codon:yes stop_codon:yes gene_type:complete
MVLAGLSYYTYQFNQTDRINQTLNKELREVRFSLVNEEHIISQEISKQVLISSERLSEVEADLKRLEAEGESKEQVLENKERIEEVKKNIDSLNLILLDRQK